jgi:pyruvate dehydrogenase E2 component (dihydrolipoamide acetyltransferase)
VPDLHVVRAPRQSANDEFAVVVEWSVPSGSRVREGDVIAILETSKASFELEADRSGFVRYSLEPHDKVMIGDAVAFIGAEADFEIPEPVEATPPPDSTDTGGRRATAKAARLMRAHDLTLDDFPDLAVVREDDVHKRIQTTGAGGPATGSPPQSDVPFAPLSQSASKAFEVAQLKAASAQSIPSSVSVPVTLAPAAARLAALSEEVGNVTFLELAIHAAAKLLPKHPQFNAFSQNDRGFGYEQVNIGFAVNLGHGLKVPVIAGADGKTLQEVAGAVMDLVLRYARDELNAEELNRGTFTVTDLSTLGVPFFIPVLPRDQSAILGLCAPAPDGNHFNLVLTFDHRLADGIEAARFLNDLRQEMEGQ